MTDGKLRSSSVMLLGESWKSPLISKFLSTVPKPIDYKEGLFFIKGDRVGEGDESLLLTFPNPLRQGKWVTIYFGRSASALSRARYIFFYGWDSYVLFKNGSPKERGSFSPRSSFVSYDFLSKECFAKIEPQRLKDHMAHLAPPELAGRFPETTGYQKAQTYLMKQLEGIGIAPILQPFSITVKDVQECNLILYGSNTKEKLKAIPFRFSKDGKWEGSLTSIDQNKIEEMGSLSGKGAMILLDPAEDVRFEQLLKKIKELQSKGAKAILFLMKEENLEPLAPYNGLTSRTTSDPK